LRNEFSKLETWLGEGQEIRIEKRGKTIAILKPSRNGEDTIPRPDFMARLRENWGDRVFAEEEVREMREAELGDRA
jgi:hypothetical protein